MTAASFDLCIILIRYAARKRHTRAFEVLRKPVIVQVNLDPCFMYLTRGMKYYTSDEI